MQSVWNEVRNKKIAKVIILCKRLHMGTASSSLPVNACS